MKILKVFNSLLKGNIKQSQNLFLPSPQFEKSFFIYAV